MPRLLRIAAACAPLALAFPAGAETLRCNGNIAAEGDSKLAVLYKCGQPLLADASCAPVYYGGWPYPTPAYGVYIPCQPVEEWLYDRGPGNLLATVRFRNGKVESIRYDRQPQ
jgi:hypothetical protein